MRTSKSVFLMIVTVVVLLSGLALPASAAPSPAPPAPIMGFTANKVAVEREWEAKFKAVPNPTVAKADSIGLSTRPTVYTTAGNQASLDYTLAQLKSYGLEQYTKVETYYPWTSLDGDTKIEMVAPVQSVFLNKEIGLAGMPLPPYWDEVSLGYNAFTPDGDVTAEVVYGNYGLESDYKWLADNGIDVKGKLVIARYGASFRGAKQAVAAMYGAAGVLIYDDPVEDGCALGPVMPVGPYRPPDGIQRGSSLYIWNYVGDPLTPGWAATKDAPRLPLDQAPNLPQAGEAMMAPLGYGDVSTMLANMTGPVAPASWQGGLGKAGCALPGVTPVATYRVGPGPAKVHMKVHNESGIKPIKDWTVTIPGSKYPDQMVILGGHRDGWSYGTSDSVSGAVVVMEMARGFSELLKQGWKPERTIVLAGWDAEEPALLGSTEWVEQYAQKLGKSAVAFINLDNAGGGTRFGASGVAALDDFIYEATKEVTEPRNGLSIYDDWVARNSGNPRPRIGRLGGGSDYQPFIDHVGVASMSMSFSGTSGSYHSAYDDLWRMEKFGDPGYLHHAACAQLAGVMAMRLANADVLPFRYSQYAAEIGKYLGALNTTYPQQEVKFDREIAQAKAWQNAAAKLEAKADALVAANASIPASLRTQVNLINSKLIRQERDLTQAKGLPDRPWYKHMIYSTGILSGYSVETLPALDDMLKAQDWPKVRNYAALLNNSLVNATNTANTATAVK